MNDNENRFTQKLTNILERIKKEEEGYRTALWIDLMEQLKRQETRISTIQELMRRLKSKDMRLPENEIEDKKEETETFVKIKARVKYIFRKSRRRIVSIKDSVTHVIGVVLVEAIKYAIGRICNRCGS